MKKLFTLGMTLLLTAISAVAQDEEVRKVWDFRQGFSTETLENLAADSKESDGYWTDQSAKGFYESKARKAGEIKCRVGGEDWIVPETKGLVFSAASKQHLNIQYESEKLGPHIWLNGKKAEDAVTIPSVPAGDSVTVIYSSHKDSESRGFKIVTDGFTGKDGSTKQWTTKGMDTVVIINNNLETTDLKLQCTNGMHYHYICIGEPPVEEKQAVKIGYLYDSSFEGYDAEADMVRTWLEPTLPDSYTDKVEFTDFDLAGDMSLVTADSLQTFNAVIVSGAINPTNAYVSTIKSAVAFVPMLNLSPNLYEAWGYGKAATTTTNSILVGEAARTASLFTPNDPTVTSFIDENGKMALLAEGENIVGYTAEEGTYFAKDSVYATAGEANAIHIHNDSRNAYLMIPYNYGQEIDESATAVLLNAMLMLTDTKTTVTNTSKPSIVETYSHLSTTVTLKSTTKNAKCYYTLDGTEPTQASTAYTEPFTITDEGVTVKAIAIADGYLVSETSSRTISIHELAKSPSFSVEKEDGKSIVTIVPSIEGDSIYFNYTSSNNVAQSELYSAPIVLTKHATLTAFTAAQGKYLQSESVSEAFDVQNEKVRLDIVSHFDANKTEWQSSAGTYYVGKSGYNFYTDEVIGSRTDTLGNTYDVFAEADSCYTYNPGNGWELKTYGQVVAWEGNNLGHDVGDPDAYNPATAYDNSEPNATSSHITFAGVGSNGNGEKDPTSACLQSTMAFQAPFDIVAILGGKDSIKVEVAISTDTTDKSKWVAIDTIYSPKVSADSKGRLYKKNLVSYEGSDQVFVKFTALNTSGRLFDVIIYNAGEKSEEYTGIVNVNKSNDTDAEVVGTAIYSLNGTQLNKAAKGINIVKKVYADGTVKTQKVIVK